MASPAVEVDRQSGPKRKSFPKTGACVDRDDVSLYPSNGHLVCQKGHEECAGYAQVAVLHCTDDVIEVLDVMHVGVDPMSFIREERIFVAPNDSWTEAMPYTSEQHGFISVDVMVDGDAVSLEPQPFRVTNPAKAEAEQSCYRNGNEWVRCLGIGTDACVCTGEGDEDCVDPMKC